MVWALLHATCTWSCEIEHVKSEWYLHGCCGGYAPMELRIPHGSHISIVHALHAVLNQHP